MQNYNLKKPELWTKIEWKNCYSLYKAVQLYELDPYISFVKFKEKILTDKTFRSLNTLTPEMSKEDYNPWKINTL